ncbi:MAG: c-type cytochrome [Geminicoccaceae bacterium]
MRLTWGRLLILAAVGLLGGLLFAWSGLFNIGASTGHWAITDWFLHYAMRQSVETHSMGIEAPPLDDPALVHRGAGHYASGCAPCHGAPGQPRSAIAVAMTPPPPFLPEKIPQWQPNELFWIVRHGVKFTGMPAWAALERTDEVWAMVAFLLQLPAMRPGEYRALALGELADQQAYEAGLEGLADPFEPVLAACARCHGRDGQGRGVGAFPILAGQSEAYLLASLQAYARGFRHSGIMQPAAVPLGDAQMRRLAAHYADAGSLAAAPAGDGPGAEIARQGVPADGIPACITCHEPAGARYPAYPALRGQTAGYLAQQLRLFRDGVRGGTPYAHIMATIARRLSDAQIDAVAAYFGTSPKR